MRQEQRSRRLLEKRPRKKLEEAAREEKMKAEVIDVTLPVQRRSTMGHRHPNTIALEEVERILSEWAMRS
ncbi:MAG: hypothetical protein ACLU4P_04295 [Ruminococcus sp.]